MHWIFYRYFTFFPKPLVVRVRGGFKKSSYSFLHRIHMLPASHSAVVWCGSASPRPRVMTHHTLTLSSVQFPWPQPRCHSLPGVGQKSVLLTRRGRQAAGWRRQLASALSLERPPGAAVSLLFIQAPAKLPPAASSGRSRVGQAGRVCNAFCIWVKSQTD